MKKLLAFGLLALALGTVWSGGIISWQRGVDQLRMSSQQQLEQFIDHLRARLARFEFVPQLIAKNQLLVDLLKNPHSPPRIDIANHFLHDVNDIIGAADSYLMDANGLTLAASNWRSERPFVGKNFSFRPYFSEAMQGQAARYFALGTTSDKRGYYFSYPVIYAAQQLGVVVIKMDLSNLERHWSGRGPQFVVNDPDGVIFITTRPEWLFRGMHELDEQVRQRIADSKRYFDKTIRPLRLSEERRYGDNSRLLQIFSDSGTTRQSFLDVAQTMPEADWTVRILAPLDPVRNRALTTALILFMAIVLMLLLASVGWQRHRRRQERERFQLEAQKQLEDQVALRTRDLTREVEEHKRTEQTLRDTQGELIQTAKLAVLGQMSASISHELNNPLAAIRGYADNARRFLSLDKTQQVDENLERIARLTDQMGKISSQLKFFARKSSGNLETVSIAKVVQSSIELMRPQTRRSDVEIETRLPVDDLTVRADAVQLEQVVVNLISNALQAMEGQDKGRIVITALTRDDQVWVHVDDNGPGIADEQIDNIFDPFFTTRKSGLGLGLSISARIIDNMHGRLLAQNLDSRGARFTISLPTDKKAS